jgi:hypothetical protein
LIDAARLGLALIGVTPASDGGTGSGVRVEYGGGIIVAAPLGKRHQHRRWRSRLGSTAVIAGVEEVADLWGAARRRYRAIDTSGSMTETLAARR